MTRPTPTPPQLPADPSRTPVEPPRGEAELPAKLPRGTSDRPPHAATPCDVIDHPPGPTMQPHTADRLPRPANLARGTAEPRQPLTMPSLASEPPRTHDPGAAAASPRPATRPSAPSFPNLPRATSDGSGPALPRPELAVRPATQPPAPRVRARGTPGQDLAPGDQIRTLVFAPEPTRAAWIERELSHAPITIQVGRRIRTVVAALVRDPPPRPQILIIDFDALSAAELLELHAVRHEGWFGRLIGLGTVSPELRMSLGVDPVLSPPLVRDSLLDCVAGTRHAAVTTACPVIPEWDDPS